MRISATIVTLNEERNLERVLSSLEFCDEIVVVDSGSLDRTVELARRRGARVFQTDWPGYAAQKNFAAASASYDWILSLDADEEVGPQLKESILELKAKGPSHVGYRFSRLAHYLGRWIHHSGWYPDRKVRLYDRRRAEWRGDFVHESVRVDGPVGDLAGDLLHYTCDSLADHVSRINRYTDLAADEIRQGSKPPGWGRLLISPPWAFFKSFFLQQGFRDGFHGFVIGWMAAGYVFLKYAKARTSSP